MTYRLYLRLVAATALTLAISLPAGAQTPNLETLSFSLMARPTNAQSRQVELVRFPEIASSLVERPLQTTPAGGDSKLTVYGNFGNNFLNSFRGTSLYLQLGGVAATALIVGTGTDYTVEHYFNTQPEFGRWAHPVVFTGQFLPFVAGGSLLAYGAIGNNKQVLGASFAVIQASVMELMYNSLLKAITGRPHPDWRHVSDMDSLSRTFRFGFLRGGVFWGWPSGHTAATTAVVSALLGYYPNSTWLKVAGFGLIAYTIFGVSATNRGGMHWFSDAIAGALISYAVGSTVGKYYRSVYSAQASASAAQSRIGLNPQVNPIGINFSFQF